MYSYVNRDKPPLAETNMEVFKVELIRITASCR